MVVLYNAGRRAGRLLEADRDDMHGEPRIDARWTTRLGRSTLGALLAASVWACGAGQELAGDERPDPTAPDLAEPEPARGISIAAVEVNQGVAIDVASGVDWLDAATLDRPLLAGRDAGLWVHVEVEGGWVAREIEARVTLTRADGSESLLSASQLIEAGDPAPFVIGLASAAGETEVGTRVAIELWDLQADRLAEQGAGAELSEGQWRSPSAGAATLGFEARAMQLQVVIVPIDYGGEIPALDDETLQGILDTLHEHNPVVEVRWDLHPPLAFAGQLSSLGALLPTLAALRDDEAAAANVYYHAIVDVDSQSLGGVHGISAIADDTPEAAGDRVSATVLWSPAPSKAIDTFTHETGHAQGLAHVECPSATAEGTDPSYPHASGLIGAWGYGVRSGARFDPASTSDYMSYCNPSFVSDWSWDRTFARIETLTSWDFGAPSVGTGMGQGGGHGRLVGVIEPGGGARWAVASGAGPVASRSGGPIRDRLVFAIDADAVEVEARSALLSDGRTRWISAPLPADLAVIDAIEHVDAGGREAVELAALRRPGPSTWRPQFRVWR